MKKPAPKPGQPKPYSYGTATKRDDAAVNRRVGVDKKAAINAASKRDAINNMRTRAYSKRPKTISEPDMTGFTEAWRDNYMNKLIATQGGEPRRSNAELVRAYLEEQRSKK